MNQQEVVVFDLRDPATRKHLSTVPIHEALIENLSQAASADRGGGGTQDGVLRPFLILVIDRATQIVDSAEILAKLLAQPAEVRLTALIEHDADFLSAKVSLPSALDSDEARVVWVSHPAGTAWRAGVGLADGIGHWPQDPGGAHAFDVLVDSLRLPEVFRAVHDVTDQSASRVFSLALKRTVLGLDASETIGIFLDEAGRTLVGDGSIDMSLPEPHFWELPPALTGKVTDDSVLGERDGTVGWMAQEAIRRADRFDSMAGKRLGLIQTLARSKEEYLAAARSGAEGFEALTTASHELLRQIDATDGIDQAEHGLVRRFGINVHARVERPELMLVADQLLEALEADLSLGHSVEPFLQRLESDLVDVIPTAPDQVRERIEDLVPNETLEKLAAAGTSFPNGWYMKLLGFDLRRIWSSPAFLIGLVGLVAVLALGFLSSRSDTGSGLAFLDRCDASVCLAVSEVVGWDGWAALSVFCLVAVPTVVLAGLYAAFRARAEISR